MSKEVVAEPSALDTVNGQLVEILKGISETATQAKDFMLVELPDVVVQILNWYMVYNGIWVLLSALLAGVFVYVWKLPRCGERTGTSPDTDGDFLHKRTWSHDKYGRIRDGGVVLRVIVLIMSAITFITFLTHMFEFAKIWIAPKLWLIEYAASLAK